MVVIYDEASRNNSHLVQQRRTDCLKGFVTVLKHSLQATLVLLWFHYLHVCACARTTHLKFINQSQYQFFIYWFMYVSRYSETIQIAYL
jgi:hypothetical protein